MVFELQVTSFFDIFILKSFNEVVVISIILNIVM